MSGGDIFRMQAMMAASQNTRNADGTENVAAEQARDQQVMTDLMMASMLDQQAAEERAAEAAAAAERERQRQEAERRRREAEERRRAEEAARLAQYTQHFNNGVAYVGSGDYEVAMQAFNSALQFKPGDVQAHFNIACCREQLGDYALAFRDFEGLSGHDHELQGLRLHMQRCASEACASGNKYINKAKRYFDEQRLEDANNAIAQARACVVNTMEGARLQAQIDAFAKFIHWCSIRDHVGNNYLAAREKLTQREYRVALTALTDVQKTYNDFQECLSADEAQIRQELPGLIISAQREVTRLDNIDRQAQIQAQLGNLREMVRTYRMSDAEQLLEGLSRTAHQITVASDVTDYIDPGVFDASLQQLREFHAAYRKRCEEVALASAEALITQVHSAKNISKQDRDKLLAVTVSELRRQWVNLDRRDLSALRETISKQVIEALQPNNSCLVTFGCLAPFYIADIDATLMSINTIIAQNIPTDPRTPIDLDILRTIAPAAVPMAQVIGLSSPKPYS